MQNVVIDVSIYDYPKNLFHSICFLTCSHQRPPFQVKMQLKCSKQFPLQQSGGILHLRAMRCFGVAELPSRLPDFPLDVTLASQGHSAMHSVRCLPFGSEEREHCFKRGFLCCCFFLKYIKEQNVPLFVGWLEIGAEECWQRAAGCACAGSETSDVQSVTVLPECCSFF